jgi:hypothetical protein
VWCGDTLGWVSLAWGWQKDQACKRKPVLGVQGAEEFLGAMFAFKPTGPGNASWGLVLFSVARKASLSLRSPPYCYCAV